MNPGEAGAEPAYAAAQPAESNAAPRAAELAPTLRATVEALAEGFGPRPAGDPLHLQKVAFWIAERLRLAGCAPQMEPFEVDGHPYWNVTAEARPETPAGTPAGEKKAPGFLLGAHYDTEPGTPGADDNSSGVAVLLELARRFCQQPPPGRLRFAFYALEEMPNFASENMGSAFHARALKSAGDLPEWMMSLEMLGYYSDAPDSQNFPYWFFRLLYPSEANFVAFVSDLGSRSLNRRLHHAFLAASDLPAERLSAPAFVPGVDFSDHRSFRAVGVPAVMLTDTSFYRYSHYHLATDTPDRLDYGRMAKIVLGLETVLRALNPPAMVRGFSMLRTAPA